CDNNSGTVLLQEATNMKSSGQRALVCLLFFICALSVSCSSAPTKPPKAVKTVAFIPNTYSDFWKIVRKGCEKADAELPDVAVNFQPLFGGTKEEQNRFIREALERGDDAIAISPIDPAGQKQVLND